MGKAFQMFSTAMTTASAGKAIRLGRLGATGRSRSLMVPMDHTFSNGPLGAADHTRETVRLLAGSGVDAVVLHRGRVRYVDPAAFEQMALVVHLSGSTDLALDVHAKTLVSGVEEAMRCGADAVSVHVNVGCETEREQLADFGRVSAECERLGMPLLAMMYARGPGFTRQDPALPEPLGAGVLAHLAALAVDLGADVVKLSWPGSPIVLRSVVATCPIPVLVAGGPARTSLEDVCAFAGEVLSSGVHGLAIGRNVFEAADPRRTASELARLVHQGPRGPREATVPGGVTHESEAHAWTA